ncbi:MAG: DUF58 domain-containing protein [Acidimicrobiales bacterium]
MSAGRTDDGHRLRPRTHPMGWVTPVAGSLVGLGAWAVVAHSSGSGWVQALGAAMAGVLITGMVAPALPTMRAKVECTSCPGDAVAGQPVDVVLAANGPHRLHPWSPPGSEARATGSPFGRRPVTVTLHPEHRGVVDEVVVELASSAPFGLLWWGRDVVVPLPQQLHVAPRSGAEEAATTAPLDRAVDGRAPVPSGLGDPRGVRPYSSGDLRRSMHWPATAHVGSLMVRETERAVEDPVVLDVILPKDVAAAEAVCERAKGTGCAWLARGRVVVLRTEEETGYVSAPVRDRVELGRRLARARPPGGHDPSPHSRREGAR